MTDQRPEQKSSLDWASQLINMLQEQMDEMAYFLSPYNFLFLLLEAFQRRNLSWDGDAYNAVAGFIRRVSEAGNTDFIEGLPVKLFPLALLFYNRSRSSYPAGDTRRRTDFPSWSWTGWCAGSRWVMWQRLETILNVQEVVRWLADGTWTTWWAASTTGNAPRIVFNPASIKQEFAADAAMRVMDPNLPPEAFPSLLDEGSSRESNSGGLPLPDFPQPAQRRPVTSKAPEPRNLPNLPYDILIFQTISIRMTLGSAIGESNSCFEIIDSSGNLCGEVIPDFPAETSQTTTEQVDINEASTEQTTTTISSIHEFIVLAERPHKLSFSPPVYAINDDFATRTGEDMYWVLMIEYLEIKGAYERRGLGYVSKTSIEKSLASGPEWKEIVLA